LIRLEHKEILARNVLVLAMAKEDILHRYSQNSEEMEERVRYYERLREGVDIAKVTHDIFAECLWP
jgi:hypothetical protein